MLLYDFEERFRKEVPLLWHRIDCIDEDAEISLEHTIGSGSLFSHKEYFIILGASKLEVSGKKMLLSKMQGWSTSDSVIVFYEDDTSDDTAFVEKLKEHSSKKQEFKKLSGALLSRWVDEELKKRDTDLPLNTKRFLIEQYGEDLWRLTHELEKAVLGFEVGVADEVLEDKDLFLLGDLWGARERERAFLKYQRMLTLGFDAEQVLRTLIWHLRTLLLIAKKETKGIHPFVMRKATLQLKNFTQESLERAYSALVMLDVGAKWGRGSIEFGLYRFFLSN